METNSSMPKIPQIRLSTNFSKGELLTSKRTNIPVIDTGRSFPFQMFENTGRSNDMMGGDTSVIQVYDNCSTSRSFLELPDLSDVENDNCPEKQKLRDEKKRLLQKEFKEKLLKKLTIKGLESLSVDDYDLRPPVSDNTRFDEKTNFDLFENNLYKPFFEAAVWDDYEDFVYKVSRGNVEEAKRLFISEGIGLTETLRPNGDTLMHICAEYGQLELFKYFLERGGDIKIVNYAGETPLHLATREGKLGIVEYMVELTLSDLNIKMTDGWTAIHYAAMNAQTVLLEYLAKKGADLNARDRFKRTALHWAAEYDNKTIVEMLLNLGINYTLRDLEERTAFDLARLRKNIEVSNIINEFHKKIQMKKKPTVKSSKDNTTTATSPNKSLSPNKYFPARPSPTKELIETKAEIPENEEFSIKLDNLSKKEESL